MQPSSLRIVLPGALLLLMAAPGTAVPAGGAGSASLHLTAGRPSFEPIDGGRRAVPRIPGFGSTSRPGQPMLPVRVLLVAIPDKAVPELEILSARREILRDVDLAPVPRRRASGRSESEPGGDAPRGREGTAAEPEEAPLAESDFAADPEVFDRDEDVPAAPLRLGRIGYLREQRFVEVLFTPVQYNPRRRQATHVSDLRAEVRFALPEGSETTRTVRAFRPDPLFEETYRRSLVNYEQGKLFRAATDDGATSETTSAVVQPATAVASTAASGAPRYKILISRPGIYRLDYNYLNARAPDLLALDPGTLLLTTEGMEVPISLRDAAGLSGEANGHFDSGEFLEFYGLPKTEPPTVVNLDVGTEFPVIYQENDFTDIRVYWLTSSGLPGSHCRIPEVSGDPVSLSYPQPADFEETATWEENNFLFPLGVNDPYVSIPSLLAGSDRVLRDLSLDLPGLAPVAATASVAVRMRGGSETAENPDHLTRVRINNDSSSGGDFTWDGQISIDREFTAPQSSLTNPTIVHVSLPGLPGVSNDRQYPDRVTIRYRRGFAAQGDLLAFTYPNQDVRFRVTGLSGSGGVVYETGRASTCSPEPSPVRITQAMVNGSPAAYTFQVPRDPAAPPLRSFILAGPQIVAGPDGVRLAPDGIVRAADPSLASPQNAADIVVIGARDTLDAAPDGSPAGSLQALLDFRLASQGLTSKVVFIDQVYDEFSYGLRDANAIRSFLAYAFDNWRGSAGTARPPSFVLLVGDGSPDYKNNLNRSDWVDQVPTPIMFYQNAFLGYYSSDNWLASFRGDDQVPDIFLGRISARSKAESDAVFDKIRRYEQSPPPGLWKGRALLVAGDGKFAGESALFEEVPEEMRTAWFSRAPYSSPDPPLYLARSPWNGAGAALNTALTGELNAGAALFFFEGHGGFDSYGLSTFFTTGDAAAMANGDPIPFLVNVNCLAGGFHYLIGSGALAEAMVNNAGGGAVAALAPSGLSNAYIAPVVRDALFEPLFGPFEKERLLSAAASSLRLAFWSLGSVIDLQSYTFLGDPATRLATPAPGPPAGLAASAGNGEVSLSWSPAPAPVAGYRVYRATRPTSGTFQPETLPYAPATCDPVTATSCVDRTVLNNTTYYYRAVSLDGEGFEGRVSNTNRDCLSGGPDCVSALPINPGPPSVPKGLVLRDSGIGGRLDVTWTANPERDLKSYTLYYDTAPGGPYTGMLTIAAPATSAVLSGLTDGTRYYAVISATNTSAHESAPSAEASEAPHLIQGISPPRAISDLMVRRSGSDLILTWSRPVTDIYGRPTTVLRYAVYRGTSPGFAPFAGAPLATLDAAVTTYTDTGAGAMSTGNAYYIVTATDTNGFVSGAGRELPNGVSDLAVSRTGSNSVRLAWSATTTDLQGLPTLIDHYQIHAAGRPVGRGSLDATTLKVDNWRSLSIDLDLSTLPIGPLYFSVIAVDNRGNLSPF
jgi:hypothetical protein